MSTQTPNLNLDLREGADIFNPLSTNANFETLDSVITEIRKKGGVPTYTTTASANLLKLSENPVPNETLFKFVAAGDANTWSYQETVNNIVAMDGKQKTVKGGEMYVAWVNATNAMVVIAWPDVVDAQTFDGKGPAEWASKAQLDAVNQTAANATQTAQAAATVANNALKAATDTTYKTVDFVKDSGQTATVLFFEGFAGNQVYTITGSFKNGDNNNPSQIYGSIFHYSVMAFAAGNPFKLPEQSLSFDASSPMTSNPKYALIQTTANNINARSIPFYLIYDSVTNKTYLCYSSTASASTSVTYTAMAVAYPMGLIY